MFGPFKQFYSSFSDSWLTNNPSGVITIYEIAEIAGQSYTHAFTMRNIISGFASTGIFPFNPNVLSEDEFLPAEVTDMPLQDSLEDRPCTSTDVGPPAKQTTPDLSISTEISPYPKINKTTKRRRIKKEKSAVLTSTPEKNRIAFLDEQKRKKASKTEKNCSKKGEFSEQQQ